jgi:multidrug efflux pump
VSFDRLSVREYPRIDEPVVTVTTRLIGASSEVIESQVTKPLEDSIAGIDGVDIITSISRSEQSQITVRFKLEKNPDDAAADVRDRVSRVRARLPDAVDEPVIAKVEADATPTIWLAFTSDTLSPLEVTDVINRIVKPRLQTVPGVSNVQVNGDRLFAMRIWLDAGQAGVLQADGAGCRGRDPQAEPGGAGRSHRKPAARVQRHRAHRPEHRAAVLRRSR